jgi:hypothetical protein
MLWDLASTEILNSPHHDTFTLQVFSTNPDRVERELDLIETDYQDVEVEWDYMSVHSTERPAMVFCKILGSYKSGPQGLYTRAGLEPTKVDLHTLKIFIINDGEFNLKACTKPILRYVNALYVQEGENSPEPSFSFITIADDRTIESCVHDPDSDSRAVDIDLLVGKMHYNFHKMESDINLIENQIPENYRRLYICPLCYLVNPRCSC